MGTWLDLAIAALEAAIRWARVARHRLCCDRPVVWVATRRGQAPFAIPRCYECSIERTVVEKGWNPHARHP